MIHESRLARIEVSLTPQTAVRLWLGQEFLKKTSREYARWLADRPISAAPRVRIGRQVTSAVLTGMKGEEPARIRRAVRQAQQSADLLVLLVTETSRVVCVRGSTGWLRLTSVFLSAQYLQNESRLRSSLRGAALELLSIPVAVQQISSHYFDGKSILPKDVREDVEFQNIVVRGFVQDLDESLRENGCHELVILREDFWKAVACTASEMADYIYVLARSKMLQRFDFQDSANRSLKPCI